MDKLDTAVNKPQNQPLIGGWKIVVHFIVLILVNSNMNNTFCFYLETYKD